MIANTIPLFFVAVALLFAATAIRLRLLRWEYWKENNRGAAITYFFGMSLTTKILVHLLHEPPQRNSDLWK